jgi:hypothetical protein
VVRRGGMDYLGGRGGVRGEGDGTVREREKGDGAGNGVLEVVELKGMCVCVCE